MDGDGLISPTGGQRPYQWQGWMSKDYLGGTCCNLPRSTTWWILSLMYAFCSTIYIRIHYRKSFALTYTQLWLINYGFLYLMTVGYIYTLIQSPSNMFQAPQTSFPRRGDRNKPDWSGVQKAIRSHLELLRDDEVQSVYDLSVLIIDQCSAGFFDRTKPKDERSEVLDIFSTAPSRIVSLRHPQKIYRYGNSCFGGILASA